MKIRRLLPVFAILGAYALIPVPSLAIGHGSEEGAGHTHPTIRAIDEARDAGELSRSEALLYKLYAVKSSARLPGRFAGEERPPVRCATQIIAEVKQGLGEMPEEMRREAQSFLVRPSLPVYIDTAHFRIHYSTSGTNMIYGWPNTAYRDAVMQSCETSWSFYHTTHNWPTPPPDGTMGGGNNLIDCYVDALSGGIYGYAEAEYRAYRYVNDYTAFFVIDNDYAGFGYGDRTLPMKVTVAHEYHHVVQMGLNAVGGGWFMENTSTFMEDEVYDEINDNYFYLNCYLGSPWERLYTMNGCFEYGAFLWPTYLKERWNHALIRNIWVEFTTNLNILTCFDNQLAPYGKNLDTAVAEWKRWNIFTGSRDDGNHYIEGLAYNRLVAIDKDLTTYPQYNVVPTAARRPKALAANYSRFRPQGGSTDNKITITYRGPTCSYNHVIQFGRKLLNQNVFEEYEIPVDGAGNASIELLRWNETEWLLMAVPMKNACGALGREFFFDAVTSSQPTDIAETTVPTRVIRLDQNTPNPFQPKTSITYALGTEGPARVEVFDATGRLVRTLVSGTQPAGEYSVSWFGEDERGKAAPKGVYFYSLQAGGQREVRKMILIE